jgi:hypothetical protein
MAGGKKCEDKQPEILAPQGHVSEICPESAENFHGRDSMDFPDRGNFPQSPSLIGASVRAGWRGEWQREAFHRDRPRSPSGGKPVSDGFSLRNETKRSVSRRAWVAWSRAEK